MNINQIEPIIANDEIDEYSAWTITDHGLIIVLDLWTKSTLCFYLLISQRSSYIDFWLYPMTCEWTSIKFIMKLYIFQKLVFLNWCIIFWLYSCMLYEYWYGLIHLCFIVYIGSLSRRIKLLLNIKNAKWRIIKVFMM